MVIQIYLCTNTDIAQHSTEIQIDTTHISFNQHGGPGVGQQIQRKLPTFIPTKTAQKTYVMQSGSHMHLQQFQLSTEPLWNEPERQSLWDEVWIKSFQSSGIAALDVQIKIHDGKDKQKHVLILESGVKTKIGTVHDCIYDKQQGWTWIAGLLQ